MLPTRQVLLLACATALFALAGIAAALRLSTKPSSQSMVGMDVGVVLGRYSSNVQNGWAYDQLLVDASSYNAVVVPVEAEVRTFDDDSFLISVSMEKELDYAGHPVRTMDIRQTRRSMGCALRAEEDLLVLATYGEYETIEGGATMRLLIEVPVGLRVIVRESLSGSTSEALMENARRSGSSREFGSVDKSWIYIPGVPDPALRLRVGARVR